MLLNIVLFLIAIYLFLGLFISSFIFYIISKTLKDCKEIKNEKF